MDVKGSVLVTGGTGMIGRYVVEGLLRKHYKVVVLTRREIRGKTNLEYCVGDINDREILEKATKKVEVVLHLAACLNLNSSSSEFYKTNVEGIKNVLELAAKNGIKTVVNVSSAMVFDNNTGEMINEKNPLRSLELDNYVSTKIKALLLTKKFKNSKLNIINVYPTAVIDVNNKPKLESTKMMVLIWKIAGGIPGGIMGMFGSSKRKINCVLVEDVADGIILAMERGKKNGNYLLGGRNVCVSEYLKKMATVYNSWYLPIRIPSWVVKKIWHISVGNNCFSSEKAKKEIGYIPVRTKLLFC